MDMGSFEIFLTGMLVSTVSLVLFIYRDPVIFDFLKITTLKQPPLKILDLNDKALNEALSAKTNRRRIVLKPGIICSLPIHQQARQDTPFF